MQVTAKIWVRCFNFFSHLIQDAALDAAAAAAAAARIQQLEE